MKKYTLIVLVIVAAVLISTQSAKAQVPMFSFYRPFLNTETGLVLYNTVDWVNFTPAAFDSFMNGLYVMQPDGQFTTSHAGIVKITGSCVQSKASLLGVRLINSSYALPLEVAQTSDKVFTFSTALIAGNVYIQAINYEIGRFDRLKCDVLFEAVQ